MAGEVDISDEHIKYVYVQKHHPSYSLAGQSFTFNENGTFQVMDLFQQILCSCKILKLPEALLKCS